MMIVDRDPEAGGSRPNNGSEARSANLDNWIQENVEKDFHYVETDGRENACDGDDYVDDIGDVNGSGTVYDGESQNNNLLS